MATDINRPDYQRPELRAALPDLEMVHDLIAGTRQMWANAHKYIRKWAAEDDEVYRIRSRSEELFEGLARTHSAAVGMMFAQPATVEWNRGEAEVKDHWWNIDGAGTIGPVFVKRFTDQALRDGVGLILVDHPPPPEGVTVTAANEDALGLRPRWAAYSRQAILSWRTGTVDNRTTLLQVVLHEPTTTGDGEYGITQLHRFRVLRLIDGPEGRPMASWSLYELQKDQGQDVFLLLGSGVFRNRAGRPASRLPVGIAYTGITEAPMTSTIPLLGVAWANLGHWRIATDLRFYLSLCAYPQPVVIGELKGKPAPTGIIAPGRLEVGPMVVVHLEQGGEFRWNELQGTALEQLRQAITEKERHMGQLGVSFLVPDTRAAETAEAKRIDSTAQNSTLATAAQAVDDAVNSAFSWHAWYLGIEDDGAPVFTLNRDFESTAMSPDVMRAYVQAVKDASFPVRLLLEAWQQGGRIPADADLDAIELEMMAGRMAEGAEAGQLEEAA